MNVIVACFNDQGGKVKYILAISHFQINNLQSIYELFGGKTPYMHSTKCEELKF
jgi:hypothetical protein